MPKISHQENVEAVENVPQERISVRRCEQSEILDVTKVASQGTSLLRIVEQMIDVTEIPDADQGWQRTVKQFLEPEGEAEKPEATVPWDETGLLLESCHFSLEG